MIQNYYTLTKLTKELQCLIGMKVIIAFSQEKDTVTFDLFDGKKETFLHFSAAPFSGALFIYNNFARVKSNSVDICQEIIGDTLQSITLASKERIVELKFINHKIYCHIFGGGNANLFLCNKQNKVLFALNNSQNNIGNNYKQAEYAIQNSNQIDNVQLIDYLTKCEFLFGKPYAMQFCYMNNLVENNGYERKINNLSENEIADLHHKAQHFANYLTTQNQSYIIKSASSNTTIFSLIPLNNYEIVKTFDVTSDAIKYQIVQNLIERKKSDILRELLPSLKRQQHKIAQNIIWAENSQEAIEHAEEYKQYAEMLLSQPVEILHTRGQENIKLQIEKNQNIEHKICLLDPKLSLIENANKYFIKARKSTKEALIREQRLPILKAKLEKIQFTIDTINQVKTIKELDKIRQNLTGQSSLTKPSKPLNTSQNSFAKIKTGQKIANRSADTKYRLFALGDGYNLYVGKNAANNDELTMNFAKPNDYWFHARGCSGSHCVLKCDNKNASIPPKDILTKAAEIAAFYSDAKKSTYTPVIYTQKKYVRKPKGAKQGAVVLQKETTIMVTPKAPATDNATT